MLSEAIGYRVIDVLFTFLACGSVGQFFHFSKRHVGLSTRAKNDHEHAQYHNHLKMYRLYTQFAR